MINRKSTPFTLAQAHMLDTEDVLAPFRAQFVVADPELIYLDGNSLGRLPVATQTQLTKVVAVEWGQRLIRGWNEGWFEAPERIGAKIATFIGAQPDEVIVADSTSVNLFKLAMAAMQWQAKRTKVITDNLNFPSDLYIWQGVLQQLSRPCQLQLIPSSDDIHGPVAGLLAAMDEKTAILSLSHTVFKSGYTYDMAALTAAAHEVGAMTLWDLSHSVGAVPLDLNGWNVDLAVGCTYKYLNGGPGAPAFLYIRRDLQKKLNNPITGWMGQHNLFDFDLDYQPAPGLRRFLSGTYPLLSLAAIEPGIEMLQMAGMASIRTKSVQLSQYLIELWQTELAPLGFHLKSPLEATQRGSHVTFGHEDGWRINQAYIQEMKVIPDFRRPDNLRFGISPLYNSFADIFTAVDRLKQVVTKALYKKYNDYDGIVT